MSQCHSSYIPIRHKCVIPKNTNEAISLVEFAKQEHVDYRTVYYWLKTHKITGYKIGGHWYIHQRLFRRSDLKSRDQKIS